MNKYKQVSVYTGYAENSIQTVSLIGIPGDVYAAGKHVEYMIQQTVYASALDDTERDKLKPYVDEFFTGVAVVNGIAFVSEGEENVTLVIPEGHVWYDRVDDEQDLYENYMDEWQALLDESCGMYVYEV